MVRSKEKKLIDNTWKILQLHIGSYGHFNQVFLAPRDILKAFKASLHMEEQSVGYDVKLCMASLVVNMLPLKFVETSGKQGRALQTLDYDPLL